MTKSQQFDTPWQTLFDAKRAEREAYKAKLKAIRELRSGLATREACELAKRKHEEAKSALQQAQIDVGREERDHNGELQLAFEAHGNWLALHTAIRVSYNLPVPDRSTPFPVEMYYVPAWVLDACYEFVTERLKKGAGRGRHARWLTKYSEQLKDKNRWRVVSWCESQGLSPDDAKDAAADYLHEPFDTIDKAVDRVRALMRVANQHSPGFGQTLDPVFEPYPEDQDPRVAALLERVPYNHFGSVEHFGAVVKAMADHGETREQRLLKDVQDAAHRAATAKRRRAIK